MSPCGWADHPLQADVPDGPQPELKRWACGMQSAHAEHDGF